VDQEELQPGTVTEDEEFSLLLESPDLNVQLDLNPEELDEDQAKKKSAKARDADEEDDLDDLEEEEE